MAINPVQLEHRLFTVDEYERMVSVGVLAEDDRLELIEGDILTMPPIGGSHIRVVNRLTRLLVQGLQDRAVVTVQNPIRLSNSEPQPDLAILALAVEQHAAAVSGTGDVILLIEVSDSTTLFDRSVKVPLYGLEGIPETWLVELTEGVIEVYRGPSAAGYTKRRHLVWVKRLHSQRFQTCTWRLMTFWGNDPFRIDRDAGDDDRAN